jgi:hypothetical protein
MTVRPLSAYCLHRRDWSGLVIGYGYAPLRDIAHHGPVLAGLIAQATDVRAPPGLTTTAEDEMAYAQKARTF